VPALRRHGPRAGGAGRLLVKYPGRLNIILSKK
jgi:hypothetical protein